MYVCMSVCMYYRNCTTHTHTHTYVCVCVWTCMSVCRGDLGLFLGVLLFLLLLLLFVLFLLFCCLFVFILTHRFSTHTNFQRLHFRANHRDDAARLVAGDDWFGDCCTVVTSLLPARNVGSTDRHVLNSQLNICKKEKEKH